MTTTDLAVGAVDAIDAALVHLTGDDSVLRMSETEAERRSGYQEPTDEGVGERMIMNMGPQHPSTHGVLRIVLELDGELITRSKPVIGYLHTGMEKTGEDLTYLQGPPTSPGWTTRRRCSTSWPSRWPPRSFSRSRCPSGPSGSGC